MKYKKSILALALLVLLVALLNQAYAQSPRGGNKIVITHISTAPDGWRGEGAKPGSGVELVNEQRKPTLLDIVDAKRRGKKVTTIIDMSNDTFRGSHAFVIYGINTTAYYTNNSNNDTVVNHFIMLYDPTTNMTYNSTFAAVGKVNSTAYIQWDGEWTPVIEVITVASVAPPRPSPTQLKKMPLLVSFIPIFVVDGRKSALDYIPYFH